MHTYIAIIYILCNYVYILCLEAISEKTTYQDSIAGISDSSNATSENDTSKERQVLFIPIIIDIRISN